jgi:hypothetical protein
VEFPTVDAWLCVASTPLTPVEAGGIASTRTGNAPARKKVLGEQWISRFSTCF